jgi:O-antigen ligase
MSQTTIASFATDEEHITRLRIADLLHEGVFGGLLLLLVVSAVPYGTAEPWWKAAFVCSVFAICIVAIMETLLSGESRIGGSGGLLLSMLALCGLSFLQTSTITGGSPDPAVAALRPWNAISADPYQTRFFILQLLALTTCLALLYRYCNTEKRINVLIHVIIGLAVASAVFGILRQTVQQQPGFGLPRTRPGLGYGQFINKNHFAYLMEMALGLGVGMCLASGLRRQRSMVYVAMLLPIWMGLVLSNSRGGILAMLAQVVLAATLLTSHFGSAESSKRFGKFGKSVLVRSALLFCLLLVILLGTVWVGGDRLVSSFEAASSELTPTTTGLREGATRTEIWRASWKMFAAHPILGVGLGGYWVAITAYHDASGALTPQEAHNDYLELLTSGGLVGLVIGMTFVVILLRRIRQNLTSDNHFQRGVCFAAVLGITGVAVHSLVDFGLHLLVNALVFLALVMIATRRIEVEGH